MMKKILCLLAALLLCAVCAAAWAETAPQPVTAAEIETLLNEVRAEALASQPLNDPAAEDAQSEDGACFLYPFVRIYADGTVLAADTPVNALAFVDSEGPVFRGTGVDMLLSDLLAAFPLENPDCAGTREEAVLYLSAAGDGGFVYGRLYRDGQRALAAEYGEVLPEGENFRRAAVTYSLQNGLVTSIRAEGLNPARADLDRSQAEEMYRELEALAAREEYRAVKTSRNGLELTPFGAEDLSFSGFSYADMTPDNLPGPPETELIDNEDGSWLLRCEGDGYEAVFRCDSEGGNAEILSFSLLDGSLEGPRCVRLGDLFSEDFQRFRSGESEMGEDLRELLYGTEGEAPWGMAWYDSSAGEMTLQYVTALDDGRTVELLLKYGNNLLTEIILHGV